MAALVAMASYAKHDNRISGKAGELGFGLIEFSGSSCQKIICISESKPAGRLVEIPLLRKILSLEPVQKVFVDKHGTAKISRGWGHHLHATSRAVFDGIADFDQYKIGSPTA